MKVFSFSLKIHIMAIEKILFKKKKNTVADYLDTVSVQYLTAKNFPFKYVFKLLMQKFNVAICYLLKIIFV